MPEQSPRPDGWELACLGILRSEFGRHRSRALDKAMMQLSAEQAWIEDRAEVARVSWWKKVQEAVTGLSIIHVGLGLAILTIIGMTAWEFRPLGHQSSQFENMASGCKIGDALDARWSGGAPLKIGDYLPATTLHLQSGVVELAFASGAKAAIEGPAEIKVTKRNSIELRQGKLSADVPHQAIGFAVQTPNATVTDLGTRFGIDAKARDASEVDVFEGKVHVVEGHNTNNTDTGWSLTRNMAMVLDSRGGVTAAAAPESSFPQPGRSVLIRPANCGFDSLEAMKLGGFPATLGFWSGPAYTLTGPAKDMRPVQGRGMLRFLAPPRENGSAVDSVVWQVIDLHPARDFIAAYGIVDLKAWVQFNRVAGDSHAATKFKISIAAFRGQPTDAAAMWAARDQTALAVAEKELISDNDPKTWEKTEAVTHLSTEADFAVLEIRAIAPKDTPANINPFPGHYADLIDAKVCLPLRPSTLNAAH
jgi:FecR-like protein